MKRCIDPWSLLIGVLVAFYSLDVHCEAQIGLRGAVLVDQIISLSGPDIEAKAAVASGFSEKSSYKDKEVSYVISEGGEIEVVGVAGNSKSIAEYSNRIAVNDIGQVEVSEIRPVTSNGIRKAHFVFRVTAGSARYETVYGIVRKPRERVTLQFLQEACMNVGQTAGGMIPYFDCESYVYGVLGTYLEVKNYIPADKRACFPADIPPWRVLEISEQLNADYKFNDVAAPLLIEALRKKFPCIKQ